MNAKDQSTFNSKGNLSLVFLDTHRQADLNLRPQIVVAFTTEREIENLVESNASMQFVNRFH